jgi:hypothetical protein
MKIKLRFIGNTPSHRLSYDNVAVDENGKFYTRMACDPDFDHCYEAVAECPPLDTVPPPSDTFHEEEVNER